MNRVLILGGYGGFGARLSRRLAGSGWSVLVAGRHIETAQSFCATVPGTEALFAERNGDIGSVLAEHRPDILIDAAGPFQGSSYAVAEACIAQGVHYLDLADGRDFVTGIGCLDAAAKHRGVSVVSGASSVPALSGAAIRHLARDMDDVRAVEMSISASSRAGAGASVSASILSYVGKPVRLWQGQRWKQSSGWHMLRRQRYAIDGARPLSRLTALADVPDHAIVPTSLAGQPATVFRAGPEFALQTIGLWLLSWAVRWGLMQSLIPIAPMLRWLQGLTTRIGSDRSAMTVEVRGFSGRQASERRWTLIADRGDGPEIPAMAAALLCGMLRDGKLAGGAQHAGELLTLGQFEPLFQTLAIKHQTDVKTLMPLYQRVLGKCWDDLAPAVQSMHRLIGDGAAVGQARVIRGKSPVASLLCTVMRMPPAGDYAVHVGFSEQGGAERWNRDFGGHCFSSELSHDGGRIVERFGPMRFHFDLPASDGGIAMVLHRWSIAHIPMPMLLAPRITAREHQDESGVFRFDVRVELPVIGDIVGYSGSLKGRPCK